MTGTSKKILLTFNGITLVLGGCLLGFSYKAFSTAKFAPDATYALFAFSFFVFAMGFLGYFGARNDNKTFLTIYLWVVAIITILLFAFCVVAFKASSNQQMLDDTWNKMSYADKRSIAARFDINLPADQAAGTAMMVATRDKVLTGAKEHMRLLGGFSVATATILLLSLGSAYHVRSQIKEKH